MTKKYYKFTFKRNQDEWRPDRDNYTIKLNGKMVGLIYLYPTIHIKFQIAQVSTPENKSPRRWVTLKFRPESIEEAKEWLATNNKLLQDQLNIYMEDE